MSSSSSFFILMSQCLPLFLIVGMCASRSGCVWRRALGWGVCCGPPFLSWFCSLGDGMYSLYSRGARGAGREREVDH